VYTTLKTIPKTADAAALEEVAGVALPDAGDTATDPAVKALRRARVRRVSGLVLTLGTVSFFTDLSSEMIVAVLPVYLTVVLRLSPVQYGFIDGIYNGVTAAVQLVGGIAADLTRRPKLVMIAGYGASCVCKLFFLPAQTFFALSSLVAFDRAGKGLRTAPRDAVIVEHSEPGSLGYSFGVHRAMDTAGALGGPLIAFGLLALLSNGWQALFVLSFGLAAIGVAVLVLFVPGGRPDTLPDGAGTPETEAAPAETATETATATATQVAGEQPVVRKGALRRTAREVLALTSTGPYRRLLAIGTLVSLLTISDGFVYLILRDRVGISATVFPLLFVGSSASYLLLSIPLGRLADRIGRGRVFLAGHAAAALAYLLLWLLPANWTMAGLVLALVGAYYAATDGVLPALTAPVTPERVRTSGIAGVQTMVAVGGLFSSMLFGILWTRLGVGAVLGGWTGALVVVIALSAWLLRGVVKTQAQTA
jgi:MFS family permease